MLVARVEWGVQAKVNPDATAHKRLAIELLPYGYCGIDVEEGCHYAPERLEGRPGMYWSVLVDRLADLY